MQSRGSAQSSSTDPTWGAPLASSDEGWLGLPTALVQLPGNGAELIDYCTPTPLLVMACSGSGKRFYTCGLRKLELYSAPQMIDFCGAGFEIEHGRWEGVPGELIAIQFPTTTINRLLHTDGQSFDLPTQHQIFDNRLNELVRSLWSEAASGSPSGALYTEGLTLALLGLLTSQHGASRAHSTTQVSRFSARQRARLRAFIAEELSKNLCVERLSAVIGMSPDHFSRTFKATFGRSPHAFVLDERIEAASRELRLDRDRSIADIASGTGFSSQAHFTETFRRKIGTTPARWRKAG